MRIAALVVAISPYTYGAVGLRTPILCFQRMLTRAKYEKQQLLLAWFERCIGHDWQGTTVQVVKTIVVICFGLPHLRTPCVTSSTRRNLVICAYEDCKYYQQYFLAG